MVRSTVTLLFLLSLGLAVSAGFKAQSVTEGEDVVLPCATLPTDKSDCPNTRWVRMKNRRVTVLRRRQGWTAEGVSLGQNCSLVLKKVTAEQAGRYKCQDFDGEDVQVTVIQLRVTAPSADRTSETEGSVSTGNIEVPDKVFISQTVKEGEDVVLMCNTLPTNQSDCPHTRWVQMKNRRVSVLRNRQGVKADGVSLLHNCFLLLHQVTAEQTGQYKCQEVDGEDVQVTVIQLTVTPSSGQNQSR